LAQGYFQKRKKLPDMQLGETG